MKKKIMITAFATIFALGLSGCSLMNSNGSQGVKIDAKHFPDQTLREFVKEKLDLDVSGDLDQSEISQVTSISLVRANITDFKGIEYFTELRELDCTGNEIKSLDVSGNPKLEILNCSFNTITSLDVSNNSELRELYCNVTNLTALDVTQNPELEKLDCSGTEIASLNLGKNTKLSELDCSLTKLTELEVKNNVKLQNLVCNDTGLTKLDVSANTELSYIFLNEDVELTGASDALEIDRR